MNLTNFLRLGVTLENFCVYVKGYFEWLRVNIITSIAWVYQAIERHATWFPPKHRHDYIAELKREVLRTGMGNCLLRLFTPCIYISTCVTHLINPLLYMQTCLC